MIANPPECADLGSRTRYPFFGADPGQIGVAAKPHRRVLVVEDEFFLAIEIEEWLDEAGYDVIDVVHTAEDAIKTAVAEKPHLIIMDIRLPGERDGISAALEVFTRTGIRSIFATAHADIATRARGDAARPIAWLQKPFTPELILETVEAAFNDISE